MQGKRSRWIHPLALVAALVAGAASAQERNEGLEEQLLELDRAFEQATLERGIEGWLSYFSEDAVRFDFSGDLVQGHEAIRAFDGPAFSDPQVRLRWTPGEARAFSMALGFTRGTYEVEKRTEAGEWQVVSTGRYLTWWRRGTLGWKVILDTGVPDPPSPPSSSDASEADGS